MLPEAKTKQKSKCSKLKRGQIPLTASCGCGLIINMATNGICPLFRTVGTALGISALLRGGACPIRRTAGTSRIPLSAACDG